MALEYQKGRGKTMFGKTEQLVLVLVIILVLFGAKKLPELAKSLGESARELRKGLSGEDNDNEVTKSAKK